MEENPSVDHTVLMGSKAGNHGVAQNEWRRQLYQYEEHALVGEPENHGNGVRDTEDGRRSVSTRIGRQSNDHVKIGNRENQQSWSGNWEKDNVKIGIGGNKHTSIRNQEVDVRMGNRENDVRIGNRESDSRIGNQENRVRMGNLENDARIGYRENDARIGNQENRAKLGNQENVRIKSIGNQENEVLNVENRKSEWSHRPGMDNKYTRDQYFLHPTVQSTQQDIHRPIKSQPFGFTPSTMTGTSQYPSTHVG